MLPLKQSTPGLLVSFALLLSALSSDGSQISAQTISADKLFASDRVTDIKISVKESDWDTLRSQSRSFVDSLGTEVADSPFTYVPADLTIDGQLIENVGIRKKGFLGSLDSERPSLKIRFDKYQPQDPVPGLSRLTLNNNKQDPSRICQFLTYKLFNDSGTFSPRCGFVKLTVNGNYLGIYSNVESIKPEFLERGFQDGSGDYFEGTVADFFPDWIQKFEKKNKSASRDHLLEIAKLLNQETLNLTELDKHIDIDAFLKFWAMESLIGFWDGYCSNQNNFFIYENPQNSKLYFIPWGTDSCFTQTTPLPPYRIRPKSVHAKSILPNKLYRNPKTQKRYDETLMSLLETHWKEDDLFAEIKRLDALLSEHLLESNVGHEAAIAKIDRFIKSRRENLMREYKSGSPQLRSREHSLSYFEPIGTAKVNFSTKWHSPSAQKNINELGDIEMELILGDEKVTLTQVHSYAETSSWPSEGDPPPSIVLIGTRKSDNVKLTFGMSPNLADEFKPTNGQPIGVTGIYFEGMDFMPEEGMQMIGGTVVLTEASRKNGAPVVGTMTLSIQRLRAGKPIDKE